MSLRAGSLKSKIRYGYYLCIALVILVSTLNYLNLKRLDRKVAFGFVISELFDTALEMRRFEKNYFLYKDQAEYDENLRYTDKALEILKKNSDAISRLATSSDIASVQTSISDYRAAMAAYYRMDKARDPVKTYVLEGRIRELGKKVVSLTEGISTAERSYIKSLISRSEKILLGSVIVLIFVALAIGSFLSRMVVQPLKGLEGSMQRIAEGKFDCMEVVSSDTEIMSLSNACNKMISEIELRQKKFVMQSEKLVSLGTMVSGVAHELNNPLSNISTSCQIMMEEVDSQDVEYKSLLLGQIESEIERAKTMVRTLLEFSRKTEFARKPYALNFIVEETLRLLHGDIPTKVEIATDVPEGLWVHVDKQRIQQALLNLIKNAIDAIPDEGTVSVHAERSESGDRAIIRVSDTGMGIDPEALGTIFEPFYTTKEDGKGSGLGLFVTKEIVEDHSGAISVASTVGEGTTFSIELPVKEV